MEYQRLINLLDTTSDNMPRFITRKWIEVHDQSGNAENRYKSSKKIRLKKSMLQSDLWDYSDEYIVEKTTITVRTANNDAYDKKLAFKNNAIFIFCITKFNNTLIGNAEYLYFVMPMHNLIEYSKNYSKASGNLWNYSIKDSKSFVYKTSITGKLEGENATKCVKIAVLLKHLSNFWTALDMSLINCKVSLTSTCSANCVLISNATRDAVLGDNPIAGINSPTSATFKIRDTNLYVPVVTLSTQDDNKLLEQLKTGCKRTIKWNKYRSERNKQTKNNNLNYSIDPAFRKGNRLFVISF